MPPANSARTRESPILEIPSRLMSPILFGKGGLAPPAAIAAESASLMLTLPSPLISPRCTTCNATMLDPTFDEFQTCNGKDPGDIIIELGMITSSLDSFTYVED